MIAASPAAQPASRGSNVFMGCFREAPASAYALPAHCPPWGRDAESKSNAGPGVTTIHTRPSTESALARLKALYLRPGLIGKLLVVFATAALLTVAIALMAWFSFQQVASTRATSSTG
jgi:hypothetical protein